MPDLFSRYFFAGDAVIKELYQQHKSVINAVLLTAVTGMVSIYPFYESYFRFTLGVVVLSALLLYFPKLPAIWTAVFSGAMVFAVRSAVYLPLGAAEFSAAVVHNMPALVYYFTFGLCFSLFRIRRFLFHVPALILLLSVTDIVSNCLELAARGELIAKNLEQLLVMIATVGLTRAGIAIAAYYGLKQYRDFALAEDRLSRYAQLTVLTAQLKAELFYLKKSSQDIENVMEQSYSLYKELQACQNQELGGQALAVARNIHEVKKDYSRVVHGIERVLEPSVVEEGMRLTEIFYIIEQNTRRLVESSGRQLEISISCADDFRTGQHYTIVSILNNLIVNAIEAAAVSCHIEIQQALVGQTCQFTVQDRGCGIQPDDLDLIFQPGYSTKYCVQTGKMSTGLGLAHVKNLTERLGGTLEVASQPGEYTRITVFIPIEKLLL